MPSDQEEIDELGQIDGVVEDDSNENDPNIHVQEIIEGFPDLILKNTVLQKSIWDLQNTLKQFNERQLSLEQFLLIANEKDKAVELNKKELLSYHTEILRTVLSGADISFKDALAIELNTQLEEILSPYYPLKLELMSQNSIKNQRVEDLESPRRVGKINSDLKLPKLNLPNFSDNSADPSNFQTFLSSFQKLVGYTAEISFEHKFLYLKSCLSGRALRLVENLPLNSTSYFDALTILESTFLDKEAIVEFLINSIIDKPLCRNSEEVKEMFVELSQISILLDRNEKPLLGAGNHALFDNLVRRKIPPFIMRELCRRTKVRFPSFSQMENHLLEVVNLFSSAVKYGKPKEANKTSFSKTNVAKNSKTVEQKTTVFPVKSVPLNKESNNEVTGCKFCADKGDVANNHSSLYCKRFPTFASRKKRCQEIGRCHFCMSTRHKSDSCFGLKNALNLVCKSCNSKSHVTPMCSSMSLSLSASKVSKTKSDGKF